MEANNLGLDGTAIDSTCINDTFEKITALGMPIDSMMMKYSTLKPLIQSSSPRSGSPP